VLHPLIGRTVLYRATMFYTRPAIVVDVNEDGSAALNVHVLPSDTTTGQPVLSVLNARKGFDVGEWMSPGDDAPAPQVVASESDARTIVQSADSSLLVTSPIALVPQPAVVHSYDGPAPSLDSPPPPVEQSIVPAVVAHEAPPAA
jgi:hypothetical protein